MKIAYAGISVTILLSFEFFMYKDTPMKPIPVNTSLNRDILGKILSETRQLNVDELNHTQITTKTGHITLEKLISYASKIHFNECSVKGCPKIEDFRINSFETCEICEMLLCDDHMQTWFYRYYSVIYCADCKPGSCEDCGALTIFDNRICKHDCVDHP